MKHSSSQPNPAPTPHGRATSTRHRRAAKPSSPAGGLVGGPWLVDAGHLVTTVGIIVLACVLAVQLVRLPWVGYADYEITLRLVGIAAGVAAAVVAAWRFSRHDPHSMLMTPAGRKRVSARYGYLAVGTVASVLLALLVSAVVLLLPLLGSNSLDWRFILSPVVSAVGFVCGSTAVGIVVATVARRVPLIVRIVAAGGLCLLFGLYSASFEFLWPLGLERYSEIVAAPARLWAVALMLVLGVVAFAGAIFFAARSADPFTPGRALAAAPFAAAACGLVVGFVVPNLPEAETTILCEAAQDPNITVCVTSAQQPALKHSVDSANKALAVVGPVMPQEPVAYVPFYGRMGYLGREVIYQPWLHRTNLGNTIIESVVNTGACNGDERPESALLNGKLRTHLLEAAGLEQQFGVARDASGRIVRGDSGEGGSLYGDVGDPFATVPLETITAVIAEHPVEIAECTAQWEWFGVSPQ